MSQLSSYISCYNVLDSMEKWYDNNKLGNVNLMRFILSDVNKMDLIQNQINYRDHGRRAVELVYGQRYLESTVSTTGRIQCETFSVDGETSAVYELDPDDGVRHGFSVTMSELEERCGDDAMYFVKELKKSMDVCVRKLETLAAIHVLAGGGKFAKDFIENGTAGTNAAKTGAAKLSNGGINTEMMEIIAQNSTANEYPSVYVFGGFAWDAYARALGAAVGNTELGIDAGAYKTANGYNWLFSDKIQMNASNDNDAVALMPGAIQFLSFNEFKGPRGNYSVIDSDQLKQGVLLYPDPTLPILFDYRAEYKCTDNTGIRKWHIQVGVICDFVGLPSDLYQTGDQLEGINGVNLYRIVNP